MVPSQDLNPRLVNRKSIALPIAPLHHQLTDSPNSWYGTVHDCTLWEEGKSVKRKGEGRGCWRQLVRLETRPVDCHLRSLGGAAISIVSKHWKPAYLSLSSMRLTNSNNSASGFISFLPAKIHAVLIGNGTCIQLVHIRCPTWSLTNSVTALQAGLS